MLAPGAVGGRGGLGPGSEGIGGRGISFESTLFCKMKSITTLKIDQTVLSFPDSMNNYNKTTESFHFHI